MMMMMMMMMMLVARQRCCWWIWRHSRCLATLTCRLIRWYGRDQSSAMKSHRSDTHTDSQTDRQAGRQADRQAGRQTHSCTERYPHTDTHTQKHTGGNTDRQTHRQACQVGLSEFCAKNCKFFTCNLRNLCTIFADSAQILHTFSSRFFHFTL